MSVEISGPYIISERPYKFPIEFEEMCPHLNEKCTVKTK